MCTARGKFWLILTANTQKYVSLKFQHYIFQNKIITTYHPSFLEFHSILGDQVDLTRFPNEGIKWVNNAMCWVIKCRLWHFLWGSCLVWDQIGDRSLVFDNFSPGGMHNKPPSHLWKMPIFDQFWGNMTPGVRQYERQGKIFFLAQPQVSQVPPFQRVCP